MIKLDKFIVIGVSLLKNFLFSSNIDLLYVVEPSNWSIKWDGEFIVNNLNKKNLLKAKMTYTHYGANSNIIHFGSINTFPKNKSVLKRYQLANKKVILTWFHVVSGDTRLKYVRENIDTIHKIHTSSNITKTQLISAKIPEEKIEVIPLGIDLTKFYPIKEQDKKLLKKTLKIPSNRYIIGSFQKDGEGWGEGLIPKMIKGPDVFVKVVRELANNIPIHVLLTGPARGFVIKKLQEYKIPFSHVYLKDYLKITHYYQILDLYLITSRIEGGPKALLEAMACGIPVVSTEVGMSPAVISQGENGFLSEVGNIEQLITNAKTLLLNKKLRNTVVINALSTIKNYSWEKATNSYYNRLYK